MKFFKLFITDVKAVYSKLTLKTWVKVIFNPSLHACFLIRLGSVYKSKILYVIVRNILISKHSIDIGYGLTVGESLILPHPIGIVFGENVILGSNCTIYQNCTFGKKNGGYPMLADKCVIYPGCVLVGKIEIGESTIIGANIFLDRSLKNNSIYTGSSDI